MDYLSGFGFTDILWSVFYEIYGSRTITQCKSKTKNITTFYVCYTNYIITNIFIMTITLNVLLNVGKYNFKWV